MKIYKKNRYIIQVLPTICFFTVIFSLRHPMNRWTMAGVTVDKFATFWIENTKKQGCEHTHLIALGDVVIGQRHRADGFDMILLSDGC